MKKIVLVLVAVVFLAIVFCAPQNTNADFLRIHIRADSNDIVHQNVKYQVKDKVVEYLTPYLAEATTKQKAMSIVKSHLNGIQEVCDEVLKSQGFSYRSTVKLCEEAFPDRSYNGVTLPQGVYDALIIELGSGSGDNWWCVVYPPMCFLGGESNGTNQIVFKSKLWEIYQDWLESRK